MDKQIIFLLLIIERDFSVPTIFLYGSKEKAKAAFRQYLESYLVNEYGSIADYFEEHAGTIQDIVEYGLFIDETRCMLIESKIVE